MSDPRLNGGFPLPIPSGIPRLKEAPEPPKRWYRQKSFWAGLSSVVSGVGGLLSGHLDLNAALPLILGGLSVIFLRDAVAKEGRAK